MPSLDLQHPEIDLRAPRLLLGVGGGIAAYKSVDLVRRLRERGWDVQVVLTHAAVSFVSPLTFQAVSGRPARIDLFDLAAEAAMGHIELARWAQRLLIAPTTADLMARLACGIANDLLTTLALATEAPLILAPAMNHRMWLHPATQENLARVRERGVRILGPGVGAQACGEQGLGRMLEPLELAATLDEDLQQLRGVAGKSSLNPATPETHDTPPSVSLQAEPPLAGVDILITAGPTHEPLDPVRFLGNRSSGRMGYALADALGELGARVTLISGPSHLPPPNVEALVRVETALAMHAAVMERVHDCAIFVASAAVADYRPAEAARSKIKKGAKTLTLQLVRNPDILAEVAALPAPPFTLGFAAETDEVASYAHAKLHDKGLDMIAANQVGGPQGGFEREDNALTVLWPGGQQVLPMMAKTDLARELARLLAARYRGRPGQTRPRRPQPAAENRTEAFTESDDDATHT